METPSLTGVFRELNAAVQAGALQMYAKGGAIGASFNFEPTATGDIDVFVSFFPTAGPVLLPTEFEYLMSRGAAFQGEHLWMHGWKLQLLPAETPLLSEALEAAVEFEEDGATFRVMTSEHLAAIALQVGRPKDKVRVLELASAEGFDRSRFSDIVRRHALGAQLDAFRAQFPEAAL